MCLRFKTYCSLSLSLSFTNSRGVGVLSIFWKLEIKGSLEILLCDYLQKWLFPQCIERGFGHREESMKWQISDERAVWRFLEYERGVFCVVSQNNLFPCFGEREKERRFGGVFCVISQNHLFSCLGDRRGGLICTQESNESLLLSVSLQQPFQVFYVLNFEAERTRLLFL